MGKHVACSSPVLPSWLRGHRAGPQEGTGPWASWTAVQKDLGSIHSQDPGGAIMSTPKSKLCHPFSLTAGRSPRGTRILQRSDAGGLIWASGSSLLQPPHLPIPGRFFKGNQEGDGVWDPVQSWKVPEHPESSPARSFHIDCSHPCPESLLTVVGSCHPLQEAATALGVLPQLQQGLSKQATAAAQVSRASHGGASKHPLEGLCALCRFSFQLGLTQPLPSCLS